MRELTTEEIEFVSGGDSDIQEAGKQDDLGSLAYKAWMLYETLYGH
jgi:hypothetical protein